LLGADSAVALKAVTVKQAVLTGLMPPATKLTSAAVVLGPTTCVCVSVPPYRRVSVVRMRKPVSAPLLSRHCRVTVAGLSLAVPTLLETTRRSLGAARPEHPVTDRLAGADQARVP
jgi:hypothetical protein